MRLARNPANKKKDSGWSDIDGGSAFMIPLSLLRHTNFARLSPNACKLLLDLGRQYSGFNNGYLSAATKILKPFGWRSETTIREAVLECEHFRLIVRTRQGGRNRCNLFAFTWRRIDEREHKLLDMRGTLKPSDAWKADQPDYQRKTRKRFAIPRSGGRSPPLRS